MKKYLSKIKKYLSQNRWPLVWLRIAQELRLIDHDLNPAFSQDGEDLILNSYFLKKDKGFYVDIGANHPKKFSSTHLFYLKGWQGINIDPWSEAQGLFAKYRPRDIFINCGVADEDNFLDYYCFRSSLMNTFNKAEAESLKNNHDEGCRLLEIKKIKVRKLKDILDANSDFIAGRMIDFMNIDVEGEEMGVLRSNNWTKYLPGFIAVEVLGFDLNNPTKFEVHNFLTAKGYCLVVKTQLTLIYKHELYVV